jgi:hypothetical protein
VRPTSETLGHLPPHPLGFFCVMIACSGNWKICLTVFSFDFPPFFSTTVSS